VISEDRRQLFDVLGVEEMGKRIVSAAAGSPPNASLVGARGTSKSKWTDQIQIQMSQIPAAGKSNRIKWSPREKKANQIQIKYRPRKPKWDQMAARESPPFGI
jgi:hypothetical protein